MLFNAPFIADDEYILFLADLAPRLHAVYFSLGDEMLADARIRQQHQGSPHLGDLINGLRHLPVPKKYLLANGRYQNPGQYRCDRMDFRLQERLEQLLDAGVLDGIVFSDPYLLTAISDAAPDIAARLEAVPSINFMIDSAAKMEAVLDVISATRFQPPAKITLDRSLNRRPRTLSQLAAVIRNRHPGMLVELLANEGCLSHCPLRATHEALISSVNAGQNLDTFCLNRDLGCMRILSQSPHRILASPFIRPEDMSIYESAADIFKICGRTLGKTFLMRTINAYINGKYAGNLLDLLDAAHWMADKWHLPNQRLRTDFFDRLSKCPGNCRCCTVCVDIFDELVRVLPSSIKPYSGGGPVH